MMNRNEQPQFIDRRRKRKIIIVEKEKRFHSIAFSLSENCIWMREKGKKMERNNWKSTSGSVNTWTNKETERSCVNIWQTSFEKISSNSKCPVIDSVSFSVSSMICLNRWCYVSYLFCICKFPTRQLSFWDLTWNVQHTNEQVLKRQHNVKTSKER